MTEVKKEEIIGKGSYAYAVCFYGEPRPVLADLFFLEERKWKEYLSKYENFTKTDCFLYAEAFASKLNKGQGAYVFTISFFYYDLFRHFSIAYADRIKSNN